ncbi:hypothetical protein [Streptomyces virginiae]|uniref:hypothetical protein n=1 Tax=Streptomyces virginiae TaxID=1961 RepID=UPI0036FD69E9
MPGVSPATRHAGSQPGRSRRRRRVHRPWAWELSYDLVFPEDATADTDPGKIIPRIGRVTTTGEIIAALRP